MLKKSLELDSRYFSSIFLIEELYKLQHDRNKAEKKLLEEINAKGITPQVYFPLISYYNFLGEESKKESFINKTNLLYEEKFNPLTKLNYVKLKDILDRRKITLVVTQ